MYGVLPASIVMAPVGVTRADVNAAGVSEVGNAKWLAQKEPTATTTEEPETSCNNIITVKVCDAHLLVVCHSLRCSVPLADMSARSPRINFIFIIFLFIYRIKVSRKHLISYWKKSMLRCPNSSQPVVRASPSLKWATTSLSSPRSTQNQQNTELVRSRAES